MILKHFILPSPGTFSGSEVTRAPCLALRPVPVALAEMGLLVFQQLDYPKTIGGVGRTLPSWSPSQNSQGKGERDFHIGKQRPRKKGRLATPQVPGSGPEGQRQVPRVLCGLKRSSQHSLIPGISHSQGFIRLPLSFPELEVAQPPRTVTTPPRSLLP